MIRQEDVTLDIVDVWAALWRSRWSVLLVTVFCASAGIAYAMMTAPLFRAEVILAPADDGPSVAAVRGTLGGLASLAGISVNDTSTVEAIAVLRSREFAREFIEEHRLTETLLAGRLQPGEPGDARDAVEYFDESVRTITEDRKTGLVTISIEWTSPEIAAKWANELARRLNARLRERALADYGRNVEFLRRQMLSTNVASLQQSIGRVLESEMQRLVLAQGNDDFAFRVVDRAVPPNRRSHPNRTLIVGLAVLIGVVASLLIVLVRDSIGLRETRTRTGDVRPS